jgi:hypothetical protein
MATVLTVAILVIKSYETVSKPVPCLLVKTPTRVKLVFMNLPLSLCCIEFLIYVAFAKTFLY